MKENQVKNCELKKKEKKLSIKEDFVQITQSAS